MKKTLVLIAVFLFAPLANATSMSFKCGGYNFTVYNDKTPLEYSMVAGDKIKRDYAGKVTKIGSISINYDYADKVSSIGNVPIEYDYADKIVAIGGMRIEYDYADQMTGSSGSINCNW